MADGFNCHEISEELDYLVELDVNQSIDFCKVHLFIPNHQ
jgi:hypothetical protein